VVRRRNAEPIGATLFSRLHDCLVKRPACGERGAARASLDPERTPMKAGIYGRKSIRKPQRGRADDELSVPVQVATARAFAAARGWTVDDAVVFTDDG
jgi:hypothetical protein